MKLIEWYSIELIKYSLKQSKMKVLKTFLFKVMATYEKGCR